MTRLSPWAMTSALAIDLSQVLEGTVKGMDLRQFAEEGRTKCHIRLHVDYPTFLENRRIIEWYKHRENGPQLAGCTFGLDGGLAEAHEAAVEDLPTARARENELIRLRAAYNRWIAFLWPATYKSVSTNALETNGKRHSPPHTPCTFTHHTITLMSDLHQRGLPDIVAQIWATEVVDHPAMEVKMREDVKIASAILAGMPVRRVERIPIEDRPIQAMPAGINWKSRSTKNDVCPSCGHLGLAMAPGVRGRSGYSARSCPACNITHTSR